MALRSRRIGLINVTVSTTRGVNPGVWRVATPIFWVGGHRGSQDGPWGSWTSREILYHIMYIVQEVWGHPFLTSTRREEGGQAQVDACGRGEGVQPHVDVHTEN